MRAILSIDGGGIRGVMPAVVLGELEKILGVPLVSKFDLIAGTSTGGLIALTLTCPGEQIEGQPVKPKFTAADIIGLYEDRGEEIFSRPLMRMIMSLGGTIKAKYSHQMLEKVLRDYLGETPLGEAVTRVLISSYDIQNREPYFFKSWHIENAAVEMWRVGRATSAGPTYFEPALVSVKGSSRALVDGGVFINNPAMSAYAEASRLFPDESEFIVVAIGTGISVQPFAYQKAKKWGLIGWARPILDVVFDGVGDAVDYQLAQVLGERYFRFQTDLTQASSDLGIATAANIAALKKEAARLLRTHREKLEQVCQILATR